MDARKFTVLMSAGAAPTYSISGTVYDADGTTAVSGVTVALGSDSAVSGVDGTFTISDLASGTSGFLTATKTGYSWTAITISSMSGNLTGQDFNNAWWAAGGCAALCVAAYQPVGALSLAASYVNLANPGTNDATPGNAPAWDAVNGWQFAHASAQYLITGYQPTAGTSSMIVRYDGATANDNYTMAGSGASNKNFHIYPSRTTNTSMNFGIISTTALSYAGEGASSGIVAISALKAYKNGSVLGTQTGTPIACAGEMYIGALQFGGSPVNACTGNIKAIAMYSDSIDSYESALRTAMAALP